MPTFSKYLPPLASLLVATAGVVSLAQVLTVHVHHHRFGRIDDSLLPFTANQNSHFFILSIGLLLLYLSLQIYRRKRLAFLLVSLGLAALIITELLYSKNLVQLVFYVVTLTVLLLTHTQYSVASSNFSLRRGAATAGLIILVVFVYATIGFSQLSAHEVDRKISLPAAMKYAARDIFTYQESQLPLRTRNARWFETSVATAATVAYALVIVSLFRPLQFQYGASRHDRGLARQILEKYSDNTEDYFKLWPLDKHYFFSHEGDAFVAYKVVGSDAWILGGPSGDPKQFPVLMEIFADFCNRNGWLVAIISAPENLTDYIDENRYQRLFIGNEAVIDVPTFVDSTVRSKHFRYIRNRSERDGINFEYWPAPLTLGQVNRLRRVSNAWLSSRSRREYTFALGYFDTDYIKNCDVAVLVRGERLVAYANVLPAFVAHARTIDHMRHTADMPTTGMHYLLMQLVMHLHEGGIHTFNLGLAPLSGLESREDINLSERFLGALKKLGANYYSFGGLEQFKNKFEPTWQPRYMYYQGTPARILKLAASFSRATSVPVTGRWLRWSVIGLGILAGLSYASFPLAMLIDPDKTWFGLASELGASGQQYASLFNGLDIASSGMIFLLVWLLWNAAGNVKYGRQVLVMLALSALGNVLAAVTPIPTHGDGDWQLALHDIFSALNIFGIFAAALFMELTTRSKRWLLVLFCLLSLAIALTGFSDGTPLDSIGQRFQIILTGVWVVVIAAYFSAQKNFKK